MLSAVSSAHRWERSFQSGEYSSLESLRTRSVKLQSLPARKHTFKGALASFREQNVAAIPVRLVSSVKDIAAVTPLWFQEPITYTIKSAAAKEQDALADIAIKEDRYKLTAQYVESVTAFIPELMNYMLSKKIENKLVNYKTAQQMVRNIY